MRRSLKNLVLLLALWPASIAVAADVYLFAYFKEPGNQGVYLALSYDGYTFTPLNDGQPWIKPEQKGEIMRDVFITNEPGNDGYRMVWTWGWNGDSLGTSSSTDLLHWSTQQKIVIMKGFPNVKNTWAPEIYWDESKKQWLILWSSSFKEEGLHIWAATTTNFEKFTKPARFYDRGFPVIDATLYQRTLNQKTDVVLMLKDQTPAPLRYSLRWASGPTIYGPWSPLSDPITENWSEGPSILQVGQKFLVYYDHYKDPNAKYEGLETTDWQHWININDKMNFPMNCKHGSFLKITEDKAAALLKRHDRDTAP